jgi:hypothetical protein
MEELLLRLWRPPLSESRCDHSGLRDHRLCSGAYLPDLDDDDGARVPHQSSPAMLRNADEREGKFF